MSNLTRRFTAGITLLLIGLSLILAVNLTASRTVRANPGVLYAAPTAQGSGDCSSWANACTLQAALAQAVSGDEIWVKAGVHYPGAAGDREATFTLKNGVALYGGFAGTETSRDGRNWQANVTILSGDIDQDDINNDGNYIAETWNDIVDDNAYHVVTTNEVDDTAVLDGFIITAGQANGPFWLYDRGGGMYNTNSNGPTLTNVTFSGNYAAGFGGGMYNNGSSPTVTGVTFIGNSAGDSGGGMYNDRSSNSTVTNVTFSGNSAWLGGGMRNWESDPNLINVTFINNSVNTGGGGIFNSFSSPTLINVTFSHNHAEEHGGGIYNSWDSSPRLVNIILWGNTAGDNRGIYNDGNGITTPLISYSNVQGCFTSGSWNGSCGTDGGGNIEADPLFMDAANGDLRLQADSPCIDAGDNTAVPAGVTTDLDGNPRFVDIFNVPNTGRGTPPIIDMGAYEVQFKCSGITEIPQSQCQALVALYDATDGRNWTRKDGWLITSTPCSWYGVGCASGNVDTLWLSRNGLSGTLPAEIGDLNTLIYLDFSNNQLTGLPAQFGSLTALQVLYLHGNPLSGPIPDFMANLTALGTGSSWGAPLTFYNTNWCVLTTGPVPGWLAKIPHDGTGFVCGQPAGAISGQVTRPEGNPLSGVHVHLYRSRTGVGHEWLDVVQTTTTADGRYQFGGLGQGIDYRVYFVDPTGQYIPQYYNNQPTRDTATPVTVTLGITRTGVDAVLRPPHPPVGEIDPGNGRVDFDPNDGTANIWQFGGNRSPVTVTLTITCTGGITPTNVRMALLTLPVKEYAMNLVGADLYQATIPAEDVETAAIEVLYACNGSPNDKAVGQIVLYDPSGIITDARSGAPVAGARVTLYYVPGWLPRTGPADIRPNTCESNLSKPPGAPWSQPAPVELGVLVNPVARPIRPAVSRQHTDAAGYYGWDVPEGCWYVEVEAEGYVPLVSPVVGVPPEVTDLNLALRPIQKIYLPLVFRFK